MKRELFQVHAPISVRWGDMDAYGHVNNAVYFTYFEQARIQYFETVDLYTHAIDPKHRPALVTATINYKQQVHWPAELESAVRTTKIGNTSFTFEHALFRQGTDEIVADGTSVVVFVDYTIGRPMPLPEGLRNAIAKLDGLAQA